MSFESLPITGVAAVARNGVIGAGGALPWHIPADMAHFRDITMGGALVMGRLTYLSLAKPLPGRATIVVSQHPGTSFEEGATSVQWARSIEAALIAARATNRPVFVVGGGQIFVAAWPWLTDLELTLIDDAPLGDTYLPEVDPSQWLQLSVEPHDGYAFARYRRLAPGTAAA